MIFENEPHLNNISIDDRNFLENLKRLFSNRFYQTNTGRLAHEALEVALLQSITPQIELVQSSIICDRRQLDLAKSPKILLLFQLFLHCGTYRFGRRELLQKIYQDSTSSVRSRRFREHHNANLIKLISRARIVTTLSLGGARDHGLIWFPFDSGIDGWHLYQISNRYARIRSLSNSGLLCDRLADTITVK